ncbi:hypothetical protein CC1G_15118 [Coprinopsis cinerea okayama7|uniref:Uncharacterized protein n=1 Tax=Coprinopsis cinerea (strain Okayama-7 / 130 / ATCC MYA-4618 / FGSC 9003) TaxID=240176 RepID=D6RPK9_COPC7|nr:hypothetical protein CC1G_15118 [Coprinopsis cinerea okayama7\|eukprot:XP_002910478.1 hypothetical protein CC1G_15118 [Coprinopsis cinerea okayama7\
MDMKVSEVSRSAGFEGVANGWELGKGVLFLLQRTNFKSVPRPTIEVDGDSSIGYVHRALITGLHPCRANHRAWRLRLGVAGISNGGWDFPDVDISPGVPPLAARQLEIAVHFSLAKVSLHRRTSEVNSNGEKGRFEFGEAQKSRSCSDSQQLWDRDVEENVVMWDFKENVVEARRRARRAALGLFDEERRPTSST